MATCDADTVKFMVNGKDVSFPRRDHPRTVVNLLAALGVDPAGVVAEVNGVIVRRSAWETHGLADGDRVELVSFVGGG